MPRFEPFQGLRYDEAIDLNAVTCPPYDVIDPEERAALASRTPYNAVRFDLPVDEDGEDRYELAARLLREWEEDGLLVTDDAPSFYVYGMGYHDEQGRPRQTRGVIGALGLEAPGEGDVLPHEHTTPKAKSDRLQLLRATRHNLSPIWGLSLAEGVTELCEPPGPPVARCTDDLGVHHRLWRIDQPALLEAVSEVVASSPVVIADGHHRYETSLVYRDERRGESGGAPGPYDLAMALVVELTESQLAVRPIHRLLSGLPAGTDLVAALEPWFEPVPVADGADRLAARMDEAGGLALVRRGGEAWLLRPRAGAFPPDLPDLDSSRLDVARASLPAHEVAYQHGTDLALRRVEDGSADAAVLLRPASVAQIAATAHRRDRMPPKTTYFHPKPRTGLVFRSVA